MPKIKLFIFLLLFSFCTNAQETSPSNEPFQNKAVLQVLNKITAKTAILEISVGNQLEYNKMIIKINRCWQAPLDQKPDSKILLEVFEIDSQDKKNKIFQGWMIASSPSISSLEHPIYDIIALKCK